jgi:hypothetical protein
MLNKLLEGNYIKRENKYVVIVGNCFPGFMTLLRFKIFQQLHSNAQRSESYGMTKREYSRTD